MAQSTTNDHTGTVQAGNASSGPVVEFSPPASANGPLLVATSGTSDADSAVLMAQQFAERTHAPVQVLTVVSPVALGYTMGVMPLTREIDSGQRDTQLAATKAQLLRILGPQAVWPVSAEYGEPAQTIANAAVTRNARLIVVGHGQDADTGHVLGGEHILQALQLGDTPVFAVTESLRTLPERVVIATDFSELSAYAAQCALSFIAPNASIYLVNVVPDVDAGGGDWEHDWAASYRRGLADAFNTAKNALHREQLTIEPVALTGNAADEILKFATARNADLVVCATHGMGFLRRLIVGSVATKIIRNAPCSVLCVPGSALARSAARSADRPGVSTRTYQANEWSASLQGFSKRNEGQPCNVEVDHATIGAQIQGASVPFRGAVYEAHGNTVELIFGEPQLGGRHFSNSIPGVTSIDLMVDEHGSDRALRISNANGQTVLTLAVVSRQTDDSSQH